MVMLNYTIPPFEFLIGNFNATPYLDSISLSVPMHEPNQALLWSGQFAVSNNLAARMAGLTEADFSEYGTPARWRPYQQIVRLNIKGYQSPALRIENYRYDPNTRIGQGRLTQIPTAVAGDQSGEILHRFGEIRIYEAIAKLITAAFKFCTIKPGYVPLEPDFARLDAPISSRNPWADACKLSALGWRWLTVDADEDVVAINGAANPAIFSRSLQQVELVPDISAIYQTALSVTVTGARQVSDDAEANTAERPKFRTTKEERPFSTIFAGSTNGTLTTFEEKTIVYQYWDDRDWTQYLPPGTALPAYVGDIQNNDGYDANDKPIDLNTPIQTIVVKKQPFGYLFPSAGTNTALTVAEVLVESNVRKLTLKPKGVIFGRDSDTTLLAEKREELTSDRIPLSAELVKGGTDANGQPQKYEARSPLEERMPRATMPLKTEVIKGAAKIAELGWTPVLAKPLVVDFGFLPDIDRANGLARRVAIRENQRRDQVLVDMPIPDEWLAAGWPLLHKCQIGGDVYLMDGIAISLQDGEAKFGFTGGLFGKATSVIINGVPTIVAQPQYQIVEEIEPSLVFEASVASAPAVGVTGNLVFDMVVGQGIRLDLPADLLFDAVVASSPGILLPCEVVFDAIVSAANYQVVTVPSEIVFDAVITTANLQRISFSVTPSSVLEGNPATIDINVTPDIVFDAIVFAGQSNNTVAEIVFDAVITTANLQRISFSVTPSSVLEG
ncbi:MAG: hypothetical protein ACRCZS_02325 [Chroococcidiopsis sp.]